MAFTQGFAGLRIGEAAALTLANLDLEAGSIRVDHNLARNGERKSPKTEASRRTVAIGNFLIEELTYHLAAFSPELLVFTMPMGGPIRFDNWRNRYWIPACEAALGQRVGTHTLRKSHMHQMQGERIDPKVISSRLGHENLSVSYDHYAHSTGEMDRQAAQILEEIIRP